MSARTKEEPNWRWPEQPRVSGPGEQGEPLSHAERLHKVKSPYERTLKNDGRLPMCFPGTPLGKNQMGRLKQLLAGQRNHIGTHTHQGHTAEGGFEDTGQLEAQAIWMMASVLGGTPQSVDGYFCGGATEANDMGLWIGRDWLREHPDPKDMGIAVLCTAVTHYSIHKACHKLDIASKCKWRTCARCHMDHVFVADRRGRGITYIAMNEKGEMDVDDLDRMFRVRYNEGFRRFLVVANVGSTALGSIDPVAKIGKRLTQLKRECRGANSYLHVDAAFGGFTVPFVNPELLFGFNVPEVMSIAVDGDKMGQLPYPGGMFLCRKNLQKLIELQVQYVGGHEDDTYCGSRTSVVPLLAWFQFQTSGKVGQREYVQGAINTRDHLVRVMAERLPPNIFRVLPHSPWINMVAVEMLVDDSLGRLPTAADYPKGHRHHNAAAAIDAIMKEYHLRFDFIPRDSWDPASCPRQAYKLCIMPHLKPEHMDRFVDDLVRVEEIWTRHLAQV